MQTLGDADNVTFAFVWIDASEVEGKVFTDRESNNTLFLPLTGYYDEGGRFSVSARYEWGVYWSATSNCTIKSQHLFFGSDFLFAGNANNNRVYGMSVRCVAEQ